MGAGIYFLLNPKVVTTDGEWEAWITDWRYPGSMRFVSSAELIGHLYHYHVRLNGGDEVRFGREEALPNVRGVPI